MTKIYVLFFLMFSISAFALEPPINPPEVKYEAQICWGAVTDDKWQPIDMTYNIVVGNIATTHRYNGKTGMQIWEAITCDDPTKKVVFNFDIISIPSNLKFYYYYIRLRGYTEVESVKQYGLWSDISEWVAIHDIGKPSKAVAK